MLKRNITYTNYNEEVVTDVFYFNLSASELIELEASFPGGGLQETLQRLVETKNLEVLVKEFKRIILLAYGQKSEDGLRFVKNDELREAFSQTAAYDALFMELATNDEAAAIFIKGVIPKNWTVSDNEQKAAPNPLGYNPDVGGPIPVPPPPTTGFPFPNAVP